MNPLEIVILAAGKGTRMYSALPKVLHKVAGRTLLEHVILKAAALNPTAIHVVIGHGAEQVRQSLDTLPPDLRTLLHLQLQRAQQGTAHAVATALPEVGEHSEVLVLYGDTPLVPEGILKTLGSRRDGQTLLLLSARADEPYGYGRIVRAESGDFLRIVEEKDASEQERALTEINTGIVLCPAQLLREYLPRIGCDNAQHEYYLTDLPGLLRKDGKPVEVVISEDFDGLRGINNKMQLAHAERLYQSEQADKLMRAGVTLADPKRFDLRGTLKCGQDVFIDVNCIFEGEVSLGDNVTVGAGCVIRNCSIAAGSVISPYCVFEGSTLKERTTVGPFARLRPGNVLEDEVHVGNFVEVKNSHLKRGTKAGHLSYLGDSDIGADVNIGAGTITCNYDGANKHRTVLGDRVFVGSDTQLVAPVSVPDDVTIGAGTTYTRHIEAPQGALVTSRAKPRVVENYPRPTKEKR
ncbi:MAG: bifunctional UDP-N-acetylglucosamine diphosphorylase/glucosamine-1-phosphate N-acetyltransferase GlmU [Succinivibrio sp.]|nr:bifunctional UDP-N-acetylglucosamine diphosphorylase/glucosamine-1-phosphate N-acetyltransferase GlmU [Succinivibrio sp.]